MTATQYEEIIYIKGEDYIQDKTKKQIKTIKTKLETLKNNNVIKKSDKKTCMSLLRGQLISPKSNSQKKKKFWIKETNSTKKILNKQKLEELAAVNK